MVGEAIRVLEEKGDTIIDLTEIGFTIENLSHIVFGSSDKIGKLIDILEENTDLLMELMKNDYTADNLSKILHEYRANLAEQIQVLVKTKDENKARQENSMSVTTHKDSRIEESISENTLVPLSNDTMIYEDEQLKLLKEPINKILDEEILDEETLYEEELEFLNQKELNLLRDDISPFFEFLDQEEKLELERNSILAFLDEAKQILAHEIEQNKKQREKNKSDTKSSKSILELNKPINAHEAETKKRSATSKLKNTPKTKKQTKI